MLEDAPVLRYQSIPRGGGSKMQVKRCNQKVKSGLANLSHPPLHPCDRRIFALSVKVQYASPHSIYAIASDTMNTSGSWTPDDEQLLRQTRLATKVQLETLAKAVCLSIAQVRQLEDGGSSGFYTPDIKKQAGRRALAWLQNLPPPTGD